MGARVWADTVILLWSWVVVGCSGGEPVEMTSTATVVDSANLTLVELHGSWAGLPAPELEVERMFTTGSTGVEFFRVSAGRVLRDGRVVVGDQGNHEVLVLDTAGSLERRVGREGEGPGEFKGITSVHATGRGFRVYDTRLGRWSHFDRSGELLSTQPMTPPNRVVDLQPLAVGSDGGVLAIYGDMRFFGGEGVRRDTTPLLRYGSPEGPPDTLGLWPADEWAIFEVSMGRARTPVGFGRTLASSGRNGYAALGDTDTLLVRLFDARGRERLRIRGSGPRITATEADAERWREETLVRYSSMPESVEQLYRQSPWHDSYPAFDGIFVDAEGHAWIGATAELGSEDRLWVGFGTDGSVVGRMWLPVDSEVLDAARGRLLLLRVDELGVHSVELYGVSRHPGGA